MPSFEDIPKNVEADFPDRRDWVYNPPLIKLEEQIRRPVNSQILNQGTEGACTGFAIAAAINQLRAEAKIDGEVSARMLYEMAKRHDEWAGNDYSGSSLRGAIHGWKNMGVCREEDWKYTTTPGILTLDRAKKAREITLGAYYRVRPVINDYHAALKEVGVIVCSAKVHSGWSDITDGTIKPGLAPIGGHAFAIVGYSQEKKGFWVQNSWGENWGEDGFALWPYSDWITNVMDAWVFRLALNNAEIFAMQPKSSKLILPSNATESSMQSPKREEIAGHFVHIDNGEWATRDRYWSDKNDIEQTVKVFDRPDSKYTDLLIFAHGGLNTPDDSARRIAATKEVFKSNGIYPLHIMYDTGLAKELSDLIRRKGKDSNVRTAGVGDIFDKVVEKLASRPGTLIWEEMKRDAELAFSKNGVGTQTLQIFNKKLISLQSSGRPIKIHFVGHSTGAILFGHLLRALANNPNVIFDTVSLLGPACNIDMFESIYAPVVQGKRKIKIQNLRVYNLRDRLEQDDVVGSNLVYRKSLLYLVSNSFEKKAGRSNEWEYGKPLLGMEKHKNAFELNHKNFGIVYSNGATSRATRSVTHGGFDNDETTMNDILKRIVKGRRALKVKFNSENLNYR